jgi:glycosyltransferase involved in cell wall biosynthesis
MPVLNEGPFIHQSLGAVLEQDIPGNQLEVIVADGMSTDETRDIVEALQVRHPNLYLVDNPDRIVSAGLNAALRRARGEYIVRIDGHTVIAPDYVRQCLAELKRTGAANVGGKMAAANGGAFGQAVASATSSPFGVGDARFHYSDREEWVDTVYMGAWSRNTFSRIGLFDEEMKRNQDDEFNYRLLKAGGRILLSPKIKSTYTTRSNPAKLWSQYFQYGYWKVRVLQKHPRQMRPRQFVPPLFAATLLGTVILAMVPLIGWWLCATVVAIYLLANLVATLWISARVSWRQVMLLPLVFSILHISYGLGFLVGLTRFWSRWGDSGARYPASEQSLGWVEIEIS